MADDQAAPPAPGPTHQGIVEARIQVIAELMASGRFVRGKTAKRLAREWDLTLSYVKELTAEANHRVRAACTADAIFAEVVPTLRKVMRKAAQRPTTYKDANAAANTLSDIFGFKQPKRHELSGPAGGPVTVAATVSYDPRQMSDEQLERILRGEPPGPGDPRRGRSGT